MELIDGSKLIGRRGNPDYFSGDVWLEPLVQGPLMDIRAVRVSFAPGARTAWHTHPAGQMLVITSGRGQVQKEGEAVQEMRMGDTVIIGAGEKHWHGAAPDCPIQHLAVQPVVGGVDAVWLEHVTGVESA